MKQASQLQPNFVNNTRPILRQSTGGNQLPTPAPFPNQFQLSKSSYNSQKVQPPLAISGEKQLALSSQDQYSQQRSRFLQSTQFSSQNKAGHSNSYINGSTISSNHLRQSYDRSFK